MVLEHIRPSQPLEELKGSKCNWGIVQVWEVFGSAMNLYCSPWYLLEAMMEPVQEYSANYINARFKVYVVNSHISLIWLCILHAEIDFNFSFEIWMSLSTKSKFFLYKTQHGGLWSFSYGLWRRMHSLFASINNVNESWVLYMMCIVVLEKWIC